MSDEFSVPRTKLSEYSNLFFLAPSHGSESRGRCMELSAQVSPETASVLVVTAIQTPDEWVNAWRTHVGDELPERITFVDISGVTRVTGAERSTLGDPIERSMAIETTSNPGNLTQLGVVITNYIDEWETDRGRISICFQPLPTLLQYTDTQRVFRFLHKLTRRSKTVDAIAHYHLDPSAYEDRIVNQLKTLFDVVIEVDDGSWNVMVK